eukprot:CAMPEP_0201594470 /NCGR_PEP_ID=MMETSP0190_2-20130828/191777_1 /ASSEMBLY_ACC=CAM_ASM_000263 /TAXON_ID=37353 /ORGANISM="Rosalina sp." /LENGTH=414 /DNA_ID=CAMNT_0048054095 /DNA_START=141 /DNA_END=1386 /DNA_ORIENTATION=-
MSSLNLKFQKESKFLSKEVDRITAANDNLNITHQRLQAANEKNRENLENFRQIQDNMKAFGKTSIKELEGLQLKSKNIENKWHDQLYEHQRNLLHTVFERMERQGSRRGMNMDEFKEFELQLPEDYRQRFDRMGTFHRLSKNDSLIDYDDFFELQLPEDYRDRFDRMGTFHKLSKNDSLIDYDDFRASLDLFAEMATDDVDIEFEIQKKSKPQKKKSKRPKNIKFTNMDVLKEVDNENDDNILGDDDVNNQMDEPESGTRFSKKGRGRFGSLLGSGLPNQPDIKKLAEEKSIDLEDIEFDDEEEDNAPILYERKIVVTKRTERSKRFTDMGINLWDDDNGGSGASTSEDDHDGAVAAMFGTQGQDTPTTPGIELRKRHFKLDENNKNLESTTNVGLKSMGRKQFANLLDDVDSE